MKRIRVADLGLSLPEKTLGDLQRALDGLARIKWPIRAVVISGGHKNREVTLHRGKIESDIDLFVFSNFIPLFWRKLVKIQDELNHPKFFFHYRGVLPILLRKSKTFWAYRLKHESIVLAGDEKILERIQAKSDNIAKREGVRILLQTIGVWVLRGQLYQKGPEVPHHVIRAYLNIGESYLTFLGCLGPSYKERLQEFERQSQKSALGGLEDKIKLGYASKIDPQEAMGKISGLRISADQAKKDCLSVIDMMLKDMYGQGLSSVIEGIDRLAAEIRPQRLFNLMFYMRLRKTDGINPKLIPIFLSLKITDLYKILVAFVEEDNEAQELFSKRYFRNLKINQRVVVDLIEKFTIPVVVEI